MKKLLGAALFSMVLAACSQQGERPEPPPQPQGSAPQMAPNSQVEEALKACDAEVGSTKDQAKFDACMKAKGFERPKGQPNGKPPVKGSK